MRTSLYFQPVDVSGPEWIVNQDSQEIDATLDGAYGHLRKQVEDEVEGVTAVAVVLGDGDFDRIAVTGSSTPYLISTDWTEVLILRQP